MLTSSSSTAANFLCVCLANRAVNPVVSSSLATMIPKACLAALALSHLAASASVASPYPIRLETRTALSSRAANIHVTYDRAVDGAVDFTYGACADQDRRRAEAHPQHHVVGRHAAPSSLLSGSGAAAQRLVWLIPEDAVAGGCLSAWAAGDDGVLLGRSEPQELASRRGRKRSAEEVLLKKRAGPERRDGNGTASASAVPMTSANGIDAWGPWFDGVELLRSKNLSAVDVAAAKSKKIGIVGAGMSGLMTFLCLKQAGFENLEIIEAGERLGGRVHTVYLTGGPFDYSYQGQSST